jgi:hypothetical protein
MHETYRMLGKEREADLQREAQRLHRAALARPPCTSGKGPAKLQSRMVPGFVRSLLAAFGRPELRAE